MNSKTNSNSPITHYIKTNSSEANFDEKKLFALYLITNYNDKIVSSEMNDDECYCEVVGGDWIIEAVERFRLVLKNEN